MRARQALVVAVLHRSAPRAPARPRAARPSASIASARVAIAARRKLLEPRDLGLREVLEREVGEGWSSPERERVVEQLDGRAPHRPRQAPRAPDRRAPRSVRGRAVPAPRGARSRTTCGRSPRRRALSGAWRRTRSPHAPRSAGAPRPTPRPRADRSRPARSHAAAGPEYVLAAPALRATPPPPDQDLQRAENAVFDRCRSPSVGRS